MPHVRSAALPGCQEARKGCCTDAGRVPAVQPGAFAGLLAQLAQLASRQQSGARPRDFASKCPCRQGRQRLAQTQLLARCQVLGIRTAGCSCRALQCVCWMPGRSPRCLPPACGVCICCKQHDVSARALPYSRWPLVTAGYLGALLCSLTACRQVLSCSNWASPDRTSTG